MGRWCPKLLRFEEVFYLVPDSLTDNVRSCYGKRQLAEEDFELLLVVHHPHLPHHDYPHHLYLHYHKHHLIKDN